MTMGPVQLLAALAGGTVLGDGATPVTRVHTDTRTLQPGDLFVALRGDRFDAHDFLERAGAAGAAAVLAERGMEGCGLPGIQVADSLAALGALAAAWRAQFTLPLIAVTGSNGKTTVTQMVAAILRAAHGDAAFATAGNFNNAIGVPLTLLRLTARHAAGVVELGMNHPGEIAGLAQMVAPRVALVNNAQREHQEFMHTVQAVARENGSVFGSLAAHGTAVFPADEPFADLWRTLAGPARCSTFADTAGHRADVLLRRAAWQDDAWDVEADTPAGLLTLRLAIAGRHNVKNALAATACALAAGVPLDAVARGLAAFEPVKGRSRAQRLLIGGRSLTLVDDSYNANPDSVRAAIDVLAALPGPRLLVLGDMGEVGDQGPAFHAEAGHHARAAGIEQVFALGDAAAHAADAAGPMARHFADAEALLAAVRIAAPRCASVLVKGSRFMRMERAVQAIEALAVPNNNNNVQKD
jgi:UDP-N-acetylmuramoyl-tripeptide--D-alanyl-D-alanine ligase